MAEGMPLSGQIREGLQACRDLRGLLDDSIPWPNRDDVNMKLRDIERLLNTVLRAITS
jgi:hypothetical protein